MSTDCEQGCADQAGDSQKLPETPAAVVEPLADNGTAGPHEGSGQEEPPAKAALGSVAQQQQWSESAGKKGADNAGATTRGRRPNHHRHLESFYRRTGFGRRLLPPCGYLPAFNVAVAAVLAAFFCLNAYNITKQYADSQLNPPTSVAVPDRFETLTFPTLALCNSLRDTPLVGVRVRYLGLALEASPTSYTSNGATYECAVINGSALLAAPGGQLLAGSLEVMVNINANASTGAEDLFLGVEAFLYAKAPEVGENATNVTRIFDGYALLGTGVYNSVGLSLTQTVAYDPYSGLEAPYFEYQVNVGIAPLNPRYESFGPKADLSSTVVALFAFQSTQVREITQKPQSFSTFFGALAGWVGACSDGWGALTLLFVLEKLWMRLRGGKAMQAQLWWIRPQQEVYNAAAV